MLLNLSVQCFVCRCLFKRGSCCSIFSFLCSVLSVVVCFLEGFVLLNL